MELTTDVAITRLKHSVSYLDDRETVEYIINCLEENEQLKEQNKWLKQTISNNTTLPLQSIDINYKISKIKEKISNIEEIVHDGFNHYYKDCKQIKEEVLNIIDKYIGE